MSVAVNGVTGVAVAVDVASVVVAVAGVVVVVDVALMAMATVLAVLAVVVVVAAALVASRVQSDVACGVGTCELRLRLLSLAIAASGCVYEVQSHADQGASRRHPACAQLTLTEG